MNLIFTYMHLKEQGLFLHLVFHKTEKWQIWGLSSEFSRRSTNIFLALVIGYLRKSGCETTVDFECSSKAVVTNNSFFPLLSNMYDCRIYYSPECRDLIHGLNKDRFKYFKWLSL